MDTLLPETLNLPSRVAPDVKTWRPERFDLTDPEQAAALQARLDSRPVFVHDEILTQIAGLVETRHPAKEDPTEAEVAAWVEEHLAGRSALHYGEWVYYPWSQRLVHVLPEDEFRELRTSRNRNKITAEEQERLRGLRLGIVGLSVGQATACTLALEEVGGTFKLADFDTLELSNMNRLRAGVHELGLNKAVLTAREIFEINPYAEVEVFREGIREDDLEAFLLEGGRLDVLYDECDGLAMKVRLREKARELGIPVLMETSDRGMLDVERFDLEPERPLFHGLVGELRAEDLHGLTTYEKVPTVMRIIGQETMSHRMAASLVDVGESLNTWPQLASAVALGGSLNTDATRRMCLGTFQRSGRFYADLEEIVGDAGAQEPGEAADYEVEVSEEAARLQLRELEHGTDLGEEQLRALVEYGMTAPSGGNCQPWEFHFDSATKRLTCRHVRERSANFLDFEDTGTHIAFGALAESLELAAGKMGFSTRVQAFPAGAHPDVVFHMDFAAARSHTPDPLADCLGQRCTNRRLGERAPAAAEALDEMTGQAARYGADVIWRQDASSLDELGDILGAGDRLRFLSKRMHRELMREIRWNPRDVERTRDGLDVATLELTPTDLAGMRLVSSWSVMAMAGRMGGGAGLQKPSRKSIRAASAVGLLRLPGADGPRDLLRGGRALQRLWLSATRRRYAFQPMTALTFLFRRMDAGGRGFKRSELTRLAALRARFDRVLGLPSGASSADQIMLFRIAKAGPPTARSLRLRVDDVLHID